MPANHFSRIHFSLSKSPSIAYPSRPPEMVVVAQLVEPRIVIPVVAGSSPVDHPIFPIGTSSEDRTGEEEPSRMTDAAAGEQDSL